MEREIEKGIINILNKYIFIGDKAATYPLTKDLIKYVMVCELRAKIEVCKWVNSNMDKVKCEGTCGMIEKFNAQLTQLDQQGTGRKEE